jgi:hypothetical protein
MVFVRTSSTLVLLAVLAAAASNVKAFTVTKIASLRPALTRSRTPLRMAESEDGTFVPSALKKEIVYDEKSGRFYETGFGEGECIPDEEFCYMDKDSGESIRLTVEEKERIFLDALQVSSCLGWVGLQLTF